MEIQLVKRFLDSCQEASRLTKWFPALPEGLTLRHMKAIDSIHHLSTTSDCVRVSDVSDALHGTRPSVTRLIQELERHGAVRKQPDERDRRIVRLTLTELGEQYYTFYCAQFQGWLGVMLDDIPPEQFETTIRTIHQVYEILNEKRKEGHQIYGSF